MGRKCFDKQVGKNLRMLRKIIGISQSEVGRHLGVSFQQVQKYEQGRNSLKLYDSVRLTRLLRCTIAELAERKLCPQELTVEDTFRILQISFEESLRAVLSSKRMSGTEVETYCRQIDSLRKQIEALKNYMLRNSS